MNLFLLSSTFQWWNPIGVQRLLPFCFIVSQSWKRSHKSSIQPIYKTSKSSVFISSSDACCSFKGWRVRVMKRTAVDQKKKQNKTAHPENHLRYLWRWINHDIMAKVGKVAGCRWSNARRLALHSGPRGASLTPLIDRAVEVTAEKKRITLVKGQSIQRGPTLKCLH